MFELPSKLSDQLNLYEQQSVLKYWHELNDSQRQGLAEQLQNIDFELIHSLWSKFTQGTKDQRDLSGIDAPASIRLSDHSSPSYDDANASGEQLLREGRVGAIIVAGGQGSRLGFHHPKGLFPIGPLSERTLFQFITDKLAGLEKKYATQIPLFVMTSPAVHEETISFFQAHKFFGRQNRMHVFCQPTMPALDAETGKILLQATDRIFVSPNGHGGMLEAMHVAGILDLCATQGIDTLFYGQIDNPLSPTCSPALLGYHALSGSQVTLQTIAKQSPSDKTGNIVSLNGRTQIIEYSEIPIRTAEQKDGHGNLRLWAANIAVHVFQTTFLKQIIQSNQGLPYHIAHKRVPCLGEDGKPLNPTEPNAIKLERFIFDLLPIADNTLTVEALREDVFAPVKNAPTEDFSTPDTSRRGICNLYRRWLKEAGCQVAEGIQVEIHPDYAVDLAQLKQRDDLPLKIDQDTYLLTPPFHSLSIPKN